VALRGRRAFRVPKVQKTQLARVFGKERTARCYVRSSWYESYGGSQKNWTSPSDMNNNTNNKRELTAGCCQSPQWRLPRRIRHRTARTVSKGAGGATKGALPSVQATALRVEVVRKWRCRLWVIQGAVEARNLMRARRFL
jgi:hypothetical protein